MATRVTLGREMVRYLLILFLLISTDALAQNGAKRGQQAQVNGQKVVEVDDEELQPIEVKSIQTYLAPYYYEEDKLRNPFVHPELAIPLKPGATYGPFLPLQQYKLSQLKVNGLFWNTTRPKAIISIPGGKKFDLGIKDYVGENFGYVASIREKEVVIIQTLEEQGQKYTTTKVLFLTN